MFHKLSDKKLNQIDKSLEESIKEYEKFYGTEDEEEGNDHYLYISRSSL